MPVIELLIYSGVLFAIVSGMLLVPGHLLSQRVFKNNSEGIQLLGSFAFPLIAYPLLLTYFILLGLPNKAIQVIFLVIIFCSLAIALKQGSLKLFLSGDGLVGLAMMFCAFFLAVVVSAFPSGNFRDISGKTTMKLASLPVDNFIPYNFSRYVVERIDPNQWEVVPNWKASDRGPLGGLMNAALFILLGLEERGHWSETSSGAFFIYQALLSYLNVLSLMAVWIVGKELCGRRAAFYAVLVLVTGYFYFLNILFSWPKFLMAYFILTAMLLHVARGSPALVGAFAAAAMLSHDSAAFSICILGLLIAFSTAKNLLFPESPHALDKEKVWSMQRFSKVCRPLFEFLAGFLVLNLPWQAFKQFVVKPSPRLIYFHLFCYQGDKVEGITFAQALKNYLAENTFAEIAQTKLTNLLYPFDVTRAWREVLLTSDNIFVAINRLQPFVFFQIVWGVGIPIFIVFLWGVFRLCRSEEGRPLLPILLVTYGSLSIAALISGCAGNTVNHVWGYPAFLSTAVIVGWVVAQGRAWTALFCSLGIGSNIVLGALYIHYHSTLRPFLHGSQGYFLGQLSALVLLLSIPLMGILREDRIESELSSNVE